MLHNGNRLTSSFHNSDNLVCLGQVALSPENTKEHYSISPYTEIFQST